MKKLTDANNEIKHALYEMPNSRLQTNIYTIADMRVKLTDWMHNPYKTIVNMAMKTWNNTSNKWSILSPEARFIVVKDVLDNKALPLALEHPTFSFSVDTISRAAFDQIARARIGIVFSSKGQKDDYLDDIGFILPTKFIRRDYGIVDAIRSIKQLYHELQHKDVPNWARRCVLPMYSEHSFIFSCNFMALKNLLAKRLETTEMEDVVAFAILTRAAVKAEFPLLANYLRPASDFAKRDLTTAFNGFSDIVSVPHSSDNRHKGFDSDKYPPIFNEPCTDIELVQSLIHCTLPKPNEWIEFTWDTLKCIDKSRFSAD